jgi:hypothetical protein
MRAETEQPPHKAGCDGTEEYGPCAGCRWVRETLLEIDSWNRWMDLFRWVPNWRYSGWGRG